MLLSAVSVLVVAQSSSEVPEGLTNNPIYIYIYIYRHRKQADMTKLIVTFSNSANAPKILNGQNYL